MDWILTVIGVVAAAAVMSFWGWLAVQVISQGRQLIELQVKVKAQGSVCSERLEWLRNLDGKLNKVSEDTTAIRVALGETPHAQGA